MARKHVAELAQEDLRLCLEHISLAAVATCLGVAPTTVAQWAEYAYTIPDSKCSRIAQLASGLKG